MELPDLKEPSEAVLEAELTDRAGERSVHNRWQVWLFPETPDPDGVVVHGRPGRTWLRQWRDLPEFGSSPDVAEERVVLTEEVTGDLLDYARGGGRVVLAATEGLVRPHAPLFGYVKYFCTPPANYAPYEDGQNGTVIADHPLLEGFPHEGFADWQFFRMIQNAPPLDIEPLALADAEPVIRVIHRYPTLHPLAYLLERRVGEGSVVICALELKPDWVEARWLLSQICRVTICRAPSSAPALSPETQKRLKRLTTL